MNANQVVPLRKFKLIVLSLLLCLIISDCTQSDFQSTVSPVNTSEPTASTTPISLPDYLTTVWPMPSSVIKASEYFQAINSTFQGGVGAQVRVDLVYRYFVGESYGKMEYSDENIFVPQKHIVLLVDGEKISQDLINEYALSVISIHDNMGKLLYSGTAQMDLSWSVLLTPGEHMISMLFYNAEEMKILEYDWSFTIIGD